MNNPKDKALELVSKYKNAAFNCIDCDMPFCDIPCTRLSLEESKQCALITIDEMLKVGYYSDDKIYDYLHEVKQEIEKL
jgi:hypothetical protein